MLARPKDMRARVRISAEGAPAIRCAPNMGLLKTSGQLGIPAGPMPELEGICDLASLQLSKLWIFL